MGKIKKTPSERHRATESPIIATFVQDAVRIPLHQLPAKLESFPRHWPFPRGDLYHWIPLLDRFDHTLELFNKEYALKDGPQSRPFECKLLQSGDAEADLPYPAVGASSEELDADDRFGADGDRVMIDAVVSFTRILLEHCGNRSLYASSGHINDLLHTTDLDLLRTCLKLSLRLAQRYQVARYKNTAPHMQAALLANHYNFNLDNLHKIALPFPKPPNTIIAQTPAKGKEKVRATQLYNPSNLVAMVKQAIPDALKQELGEVRVTYYSMPASPAAKPCSTAFPAESVPPTPTPVRRASTLGPSRDRPAAPERVLTSPDISNVPVKSLEAETANAPKSYTITTDQVRIAPADAMIRDALPTIPKDSHYDLLHRVRVAKALSDPDPLRAQILLQVRLLAIANLAYAVGESKFQEKLGHADAEEPRKYHLAQQLCDILQPSADATLPLSIDMEICLLQTLESLVRLKHKWSEVVEALAITVNHGILYYELRKAISSLQSEPHDDTGTELRETEWRLATLALVDTVSQANPQAKYAERMLAAGVLDIEIEVLTLRTSRAERLQEKVISFLDSYIHNIAAAFQALTNAKGLEILSDLASYLVSTSLENANSGNGMSADFKSKVVDYEIPYFQQAALRGLFKFIVHLFDNNSGVHDRELRNLLDSPPMLGALRTVIENSNIFGSNVWSAAVNTVSNFIHNEPTSYQVIAEAGLAKGILEAVTKSALPDDPLPDTEITPIFADPPPFEADNGVIQFPDVSGILPVGETIADIPTAFGAICLNEAGMKLFQASGALDTFFDIFVSPPHVRALEDEGLTAATVGNAFDELARHHPPLAKHILAAVVRMVKRVQCLTKTIEMTSGVGAKIWTRCNEDDQPLQFGVVCSGMIEDGSLEVRTGSVAAKYMQETEYERVSATPYLSACFKFLDGFFHNQSMCQSFCAHGGAEVVLDLVTSPSNPPDIVAFSVFNKIATVVKRMCDEKPHLVLPSLMARAKGALQTLRPLLDGTKQSYFLPLIQPSTLTALSPEDYQDGPAVLKSLTSAHVLSHLLGRCLAQSAHQSHRSSVGVNALFITLNLTDIYVSLVTDFSKLYSVCLWENQALKANMSDSWKILTEPKPFSQRRAGPDGLSELVTVEYRNNNVINSRGPSATEIGGSEAELFAFKNARAIRFLLSQTPTGVESLFTNLAQALTPKRTSDLYMKQHAGIVAETLAKCMISELENGNNSSASEGAIGQHCSAVLNALTRLLVRNPTSMESFGTKEAVTLVLVKFFQAGGFDLLDTHLMRLAKIITTNGDAHDDLTDAAHHSVTYILNFFSQVVRSKCINESVQSGMIAQRGFEHADYFVPGQFLVEIRHRVLQTLTTLWHDDSMSKLGDGNTKDIVDALKHILKSEGEERALKRSDNATRRVATTQVDYTTRADSNVQKLKDAGVDEALAKEAVYRCNNHEAMSREYVEVHKKYHALPLGLPLENAKKPSQDTALQRSQSTDMPDAPADGGWQNPLSTQDAPADAEERMGEDSDSSDEEYGSLGRVPADVAASDMAAMAGLDSGAARAALGVDMVSSSGSVTDTKTPFLTVDDLNEARDKLREDLIDRCLEVLSAQSGMTFELAELIQAAVVKSGEAANPRAEIGNTLVSSLLSLYGEEPSKENGRKISAYAHLVALILQDSDFFDSTVDELRDNLDTLISWTELKGEEKAEDAPWIEMLLLIIERVLAEDEQPMTVDWDPPPADDPLKPQPKPQPPEAVVPDESRSQLLDSMLNLLPKIGKNASLALSVMRVLVNLTRRRSIAMNLSNKLHMSRLFLMIRQLSASPGSQLQSAIMIVLRHMVEDEAMIRQIIKTEIKTAFEGGNRSQRNIDTSSFTRNMSHLVLRDPEAFVSVVQEMLEVPKYDGNPHRAQALALKPTPPPESTIDAPAEPTTNGGGTAEVAQVSTDLKPANDLKAPTVEVTDGVVSFLLRELATYREVEDKSPVPKMAAPSTDNAVVPSNPPDIDMPDATATNGTTSEPKKEEKPVFKPEEHMIYIYRCFILQCLSELLACYARTKIEFINFSRKAETQAATPSKPRAGTLNYLLNVLLPAGTLEHREDIAHRKKLVTSNWATTTLVSLCTQTVEKARPRVPVVGHSLTEEDSDISFVRRFVIEHALRSFKEATASSEALDIRYSRLMALADLFDRMLNAKPDRNSPVNAANFDRSQQQLGRIMYEKNLIAALTSSIAELDLNFPNAKRAVKHILVPLKTLTDLAVDLSQRAELSSTPGNSTEEDDIGVETSASEVGDETDEEREQTPDLFRNSALGILNPDDDEGSSDGDDEEDDDEMDLEDYEEYDVEEDEMDFEDDHAGAPGEVVSDEEDNHMNEMGDIEGMPGDVEMEVEILDENDEDDDSDDDDEDEDEDDEDVEGYGNHFDEVNGDDANGSLADGDDEGWEDEAEGYEEGTGQRAPLDELAHVLAHGGEISDNADEDGVIRVDMTGGDEEYFDDEMPPGEEDEDEEEQEMDYGDELAFEPEGEDDDFDEMGAWEYTGPPQPRGHRHHHHRGGGLPGFMDFMHPHPGAPGGPDAAYFANRYGIGQGGYGAAPGRRDDEGLNPLLQRDRITHGLDTDLPSGIPPPLPLPVATVVGGRDAMIGDLVARLNRVDNGLHRYGLDMDFRGLGGAPPPAIFAVNNRGMPQFLDINNRRQPWRNDVEDARTASMSDEARAVDFRPLLTTVRWTEESRILFGGKHHEKAVRVITTLLSLLVPPAMEAKRIRDKEAAERQEAEKKKREEEEAKAAAEKAEREAKEKQEREEREAKEAEEAAVKAREEAEAAAQAPEETPAETEPSSMEGVEAAPATEAPAESAASAVERVFITIRGRQLDITDLGIDRDYIEALPEEFREEVITSQFADQRAQQRAEARQNGTVPTEISREFLDALPPELQQELLASEMRERRQREQAEARRQRHAQGGQAAPAAQPEEMTQADFFATLDPAFRQQVLMEQDENLLNLLPEEIQREARELIGERPRHPRVRQMGDQLATAADQLRALRDPRGARLEMPERSRARPVVQMLDKPGVATLLRLMFVSLHHRAKSSLHGILSDVCKNTQNRAEVISILLSILQDGTIDVGAVERSFAQLSLRAKQVNGLKTPQPKRALTEVAQATELSPLNIVQHCLGTLSALSVDNPKVQTFFLSEHESSNKTKTVKKGKGKESKASRYPLNALLMLLDRKVITENTGVMETLAALLSRVTQPLTQLLKKPKEPEPEPEVEPSAAEAETVAPATDAASSAEQTADDVPMQEADPETTAEPSSSETVTAPAPASNEQPIALPADKKKRELEPPEVPDENIRLVINILASRECPSKTFSDTIDIIRHLTAIPGTREIFGKELIVRAQELGESIVTDLGDLASQIDSAKTGVELQGLALAKFSSSGSQQRKLLQVLIALDHLFDPKRMQVQQAAIDSSADMKLKEDILTTLSESKTFEGLWSNLSLCLTAIRRRGNMITVATILLPLIESLFVVCRNSALKEASVIIALDATVSTPPPEARMDGLFFTFTDDHRKILNELIRNNPKLMNGNLSILARNSKVLEFDNKRSYFSRKLHTREDRTVSHPSLTLNVRRDQVFMDSYKALYYKSPNEIKHGKLNIRFNGEEGIDAGGVSREWFAVMARQMFNPDYALFNPVASDRTTFHPNRLSDINTEHLSFFKFIGRVIGKALYENRVLDCHFSRAVYRRILGKSVSLKDMETLDLDYYRSLVWILENDITDVTFETFSVEVDRFGVVTTDDLIPNGRDIAVTEDNKQEYVRLVVEHRLIKSVEGQLDAFLGGFHDIIPAELVSIFNEQELELLISGLPEIDVDDWKNNTEYHNYQATSPQIQWLWRAIKSFDPEERAKLLQFVTGTSKVPLNGFKELEGMNGFAKFNIHRDYSSKEKLPTSHTCFNQLDLPEYESYEHLRQQLYTAITAGSEYFGFA
ncbi:E3 ubiquitin-protein ligase tom1 [Oleoguttula sp. CCFEE 5521]